jgi:hypothetical protein
MRWAAAAALALLALRAAYVRSEMKPFGLFGSGW